mmetsp:Transcript_33205/g.48735  ORF Transcript_33205/g.48735 Transcript_33205/m.48735 type:complete len:599 (+) Transcript_33205:107-1903(+)
MSMDKNSMGVAIAAFAAGCSIGAIVMKQQEKKKSEPSSNTIIAPAKVTMKPSQSYGALVKETDVKLWDGRSSVYGTKEKPRMKSVAATKMLEIMEGEKLEEPLEDSSKYRTESDLIGPLDIPNARYFGCQTLRAVSNYQITNIPLSHYPHFVNALAYVKKACAITNKNIGTLDESLADAIIKACDEITGGQLHNEFVVDMVQGGAGTSTNMNANEVIANRALEHLGHKKGEYKFLHPNDHVNMSQSTNDSYPTACKLALLLRESTLIDEMQNFIGALRRKADEVNDVVKMGRTQLQDAVPMTLGQEFRSWANIIEADIAIFENHREQLFEINSGGTAIGTGICANPDFGKNCVINLSAITGYEFRLSKDLIAASSSVDAFMAMSGTLRRCAIKLSKVCSDLRLLSSGPRCGFGEIALPAMAPGSSIMPGKVNPIIPEVCNMVSFIVCGNDVTNMMAAENGQLQLNVFEPVIVYSIFSSVDILTSAFKVLRERCIDGIIANKDRCEHLVGHSIGIVTALLPEIGYKNSSHCAKVALKENASVTDIVLREGFLSKERLDEVMRPEKMVGTAFVMQAKTNTKRASVAIDLIAGNTYEAAEE